jgi:hypothetical protein
MEWPRRRAGPELEHASGDCPVVPGFINWEICGERYCVRESSEIV